MKTSQTASVGALKSEIANTQFLAPIWLRSLGQHFDHYLPLLVLGWLLGLLVMSLRLMGGLLYVQRLRRYRVQPLGAAWQARLAALAERGGLRQPVQLLESALIVGPVVVGHLRPLILLPLGAVAGLPPTCLEAILAHELAHVLRRDYLVNLLQTVAETVFFYHPAVWFIANCLRSERENCCDDLATEMLGGDPMRLAYALTTLAEWSQSAAVAPAPRLALAAGGHGTLLGRVRRLVQRRPAAPTRAEGALAAALLLAGLALLGTSVSLAGPLAARIQLKVERSASIEQKSFQQIDADTSKRLSTVATAPADTITKRSAKPSEASSSSAGRAKNEGEMGADNVGIPPTMRQQRQFRTSTIVIEKDKKGRLTNLVVDGQPVEAATAKPSKADRRAGHQVTVIALPPAPPSRNGTDDRNPSFDEKMDRWGRDFDQQMNRIGQGLDNSFNGRNDVGSGADHGPNGRRQQDFHFEFEMDQATLNQITANARALGQASAGLGMQAAAKGLEAARQGLEAALHSPGLNPEARQEIKKDLAELNRKHFRSHDKHSDMVLLSDDRAEAARDRADDRAEEARDRAEDLRDRRQEIQERIREAQEEMRDLEAEQREPQPRDGDVRPPRPPMPPRPPRAMQMPMLPAPPAPPRAPADNTDKVRTQLRKDGLVGKNDKNFQFQLSSDGLMVNGKPQSAGTVEKYRKMLQVPKTGKGSRYTIDVREGN